MEITISRKTAELFSRWPRKLTIFTVTDTFRELWHLVSHYLAVKIDSENLNTHNNLSPKS